MMLDTAGLVVVTARIENVADAHAADAGLIDRRDVRSLVVTDALVDPRLLSLTMPGPLIRRLGLSPFGTTKARTRRGIIDLKRFGVVSLMIRDRVCSCEVLELPDDPGVRIGRLDLLQLDLVIDPTGNRLVGNPEHGGEPMIELY